MNLIITSLAVEYNDSLCVRKFNEYLNNYD